MDRSSDLSANLEFLQYKSKMSDNHFQTPPLVQASIEMGDGRHQEIK